MITITSKALDQLKNIIQEQDSSSELAIRISVMGGGCSGMRYELGLTDPIPSINDQLIEKDKIKLIVDKKSMLFLSDTEIDFSGGLSGTGFTFNNPNAKRTCGCGNSFCA